MLSSTLWFFFISTLTLHVFIKLLYAQRHSEVKAGLCVLVLVQDICKVTACNNLDNHVTLIVFVKMGVMVRSTYLFKTNHNSYHVSVYCSKYLYHFFNTI